MKSELKSIFNLFSPYLLTTLLLFISSERGISQILRNNFELVSKKLIAQDTLILDHRPIIPHSLVIYKGDMILPLHSYSLNYKTNLLKVNNYVNDSLRVVYRTLPLKLSSHFGSKKTQKNLIKDKQPIYTEYEELSHPSYENNAENALQYSGSFVRGITVGSRQDAAINSGFNLNIGGKLANGLEINASMTDANIPIQPEGNSASIQEFDKIFIHLKKDSHQITLGDFDISDLANTKTMRFDRKLQGIRYTSALPLKNNSLLTYGATAALTRGTFARNIFIAQENNQGPYKLVGNNGETFIIIIAGTEKVFINGQLMKRGIENDYTINYNIGEVIFTPKRLITQDLRIVIEFQYSDRSFFRYSLEGNLGWKHRNFEVQTQLFLENDNKNTPLNIKLNSSQAKRLSEIGNQLDSAIIPSATLVSWDAARITYYAIDTIVGGNFIRIYKWANTKRDSVYQLIFTQVGQNKGNYNLKSTAANGSVYEWIAPINGIPQGWYEPNIKITTPKTHLQWNTTSTYHWNKDQKTKVEISYTANDLNTFSTLQDDQNKGVGVVLHHRIDKSLDSFKHLYLELEQEYTSSHFSPLTRYRNNEFQRDWNLNLAIRNAIEQSMSRFSLGYKSQTIISNLAGQYFYLPNYFAGLQSLFDIQYSKNRWKLNTSHNLLNASHSDTNTVFYRPKASITYNLLPKKSTLELGLYHEIQQSQNNLRWLNGGFLWQNYFLQWKNNWSDEHPFNFQYIYRTEQSNDSLGFLPVGIRSHTFSADGQSEFSASQSLKYILKYRNFQSKNAQQELLHNYMGRIEYASHYASGFICFNATYEVKAGREQRMQQTYVKAPNGFGNYAWRDLNSNGIFELNEAYVSPILTENNYMRYFVVLSEFIPANEVFLSQYFALQPKAKWHNQADIRKVISKFSYQLRLELHKKNRSFQDINIGHYLNPLSRISDSLLLFSRSNIFQQLSFQKNENKIGLDIEWVYNNAGNLLSNGVEGNSFSELSLRSRVELTHFLTYLGKLANGMRKNKSEFFIERNFSIVENSVENTLSFYLNRNMKINLNANYAFKSTGSQYNITQQGDVELKLSRKNDGIVETRFSMLNLIYEAAQANPQVELTMLNGIPKGMNYIWSITVGQRITKFLQVNLIYNGRKNQNSPQLIHSGNVEARAIF